jgi:hypothetical protein
MSIISEVANANLAAERKAEREQLAQGARDRDTLLELMTELSCILVDHHEGFVPRELIVRALQRAAEQV